MWQVLETIDGTVKMLNAFYDDRAMYKQRNESFVKILSYHRSPHPKTTLFCQFWFDDLHQPAVAEVTDYKWVWDTRWGVNNDGFTPILILCPNSFASNGLIPSSVSVVRNPCDEASNKLKVIHNLPTSKHKKPIAACMKLMEYKNDDRSAILMEWFETMFALGINQITVHALIVHPNTLKLLKFYNLTGKIDFIPMTLPNGLPSSNQSLLQFMQNQVLMYTDCFYKNMYKFKFILPIDHDELIVPSRDVDKNLDEMLQRVVKTGKLIQDELFSSYAARHSLFLLNNNHQGEIQPEVPKTFHFLQHVYRAQTLLPIHHSPKSFLNTEIVTSMNQHYACDCGYQKCDYYHIDIEDGKLQHFRVEVPKDVFKQREDFRLNTIKDIALWRFKDEIIANVNKRTKEFEKFKIVN